MSNYEIVKEAILNKRPISAIYNGYYREMCPHVLGQTNGQQQGLFYQYGGQSSKGLSMNPAANWRCIPLAGMTQLQIIDGEWATASNHGRPQTCVKVVDYEVAY